MPAWRPTPVKMNLPRELAEHDGPLTMRGVDPATGETYEAPITREELGAAFADRRLDASAERSSLTPRGDKCDATSATRNAALSAPHVLRHTLCSAIAEREGLDVVAELAGHAEVRVASATSPSAPAAPSTPSSTPSAPDQFAGGWAE